MSLGEFAGSLGEAKAWDDAIWPQFLKFCLRLIVEACGIFPARARWTHTWRETQFTSALYVCMDEVHQSSSPRLQIVLKLEGQILDPARILAGVDDPNASPRVEIIIQQVSMSIRMYLACEGKMVTTKTVGHRTPKASIDAYVNHGMRRFVEGAYSADLNVAVMIGFVLVGPATTIAARIAATVVRERLPFTVNMTPAGSPACKAHYFSEHPRVGSSTIRLEHLLLELPPRTGSMI